MDCGLTPVTSMSACDTAAAVTSGTPVHFGVHPALTHVVHLWAGHRRWGPQRRKLKQIISRRRRDEGKRILDERAAATNFQVVSEGTTLIEWRDIRRIRASFLTNAQTLYRLKSNSFPLWNWAKQDLSCPAQSVRLPFPRWQVMCVFWSCPSARRHWESLLVRWRSLGDFQEADLNVWVFGMVPGIPIAAWDAIKHAIDPSLASSRAKDAVFPAARELWRFVVSTTLHVIWTERLRRMEDASLPQEVHTARARTQFRRSVTRFRGSTYQPDMGEDGHLFAQVRSALADTLLCCDEPPPLRALPANSCSGVLYLFFDGGSRGNSGPGGAGSVLVQIHIPTHAACVMWVPSMAYGSAETTNNIAECWGLVHELRQAKASGYSPLHVMGDSALVLSQLRTHHPPRKPHLALLLREARALADSIDVASWGHHYRNYNKMADRLANIAMDTGASIQVQATYPRGVVMEAAAFLDNDVNHWLEASQAEHYELHGPAMTAGDLIISRQDCAQRRLAVRGLVLPSL